MTRLALALAVLACVSSVTGQFVFEPLDAVPDALPGRSIALADVDGDGIVDLVTGDASMLVVSFGAGDGTFPTSVTLPGRSTPVLALDVDEDGIVDLVHGVPAASTPSLVGVSFGVGGGDFADPVTVAAGSTLGALRTIDAGDVDGDGHVDIACSGGDFTTDRFVLLGDGAGGFTKLAFPSALLADVALTDVDGDGFDDFVSIGLFGSSWWSSQGDGTFVAEASEPPGEPLGDVVGDARAEFVTRQGPLGAVEFVLWTFDGADFVDVARTPTYPYPCVSDSVDAIDVDGDGLHDLAVLCNSAPIVYRQTPDGTFSLDGVVATDFVELLVATSGADFDGDGRLDLVFSGSQLGSYVARNVTYADASPFTDLGGAMPGDVGYAVQIAASADVDDLTVRVAGGRPNAPVFAVFGGDERDLPFAGGTLVPSVDRVLGPFALSPDGRLDVSAPDALPLAFGVDLFVQWWIVDAAGPQGYAATTAVRIAAP